MEGSAKKVKAGSFQSLGLDKEILNALNRMGYKTPTPVQRKALPVALAGVDVVCMSRTGSGKSCAFLVPLMQKLRSHTSSSGGIRGIVLSPTRELAVQTYKFAKDIAKFTDLRIITILGGDSIEAQFESLSSNPDILIATPGRLMHMLREISTLRLKNVQYLVFDEADRLFEMGFAEQLNEIVRECPVERQTLLFSATMPKMLVQFSRAGLRDPQLIRLDTEAQLSDELRIGFFTVRANEKLPALLYLVRKVIPHDQLTIVFTATRHHSELLQVFFEKIGVSCAVVYGTMDQESRSANLKAFRNGMVSYLIVTDLAARGIDVPLLNNVINFHFPASPKLFVHRCGRAARQGRIGFALSLVEPEEMGFLVDVHHFLGKTIDLCDGNVISSSSSSSTAAPERKSSTDGSDEAGDNADNNQVIHDNASSTTVAVSAPYTLETMTTEHVHTGRLPQDVLDQEGDFVKRCLSEDDTMSTMYRISENGMKQYRRTRTEASREGVKTAKDIIKHDKVRQLHPLLVGIDPSRCGINVVKKNEFVKVLQSFRPAQTVFETGIGTGSLSKVSSGTAGSQITQLTARSKLTKGMEMMKALRKSTAYSLERNRVAAAAAAATAAAASADIGDGDDGDESADNMLADNAEETESNRENSDDNDDNDDNDDDDEIQHKASQRRVAASSSASRNSNRNSSSDGLLGIAEEEASASMPSHSSKFRLSIAERKKLKKQGLSAAAIAKLAQQKAMQDDFAAAGTTVTQMGGEGGRNSNSKTTSHSSSSNSAHQDAAGIGGLGSIGGSDEYKDQYYMSYGDETGRQSFAEEALQPQSGLRGTESLNAMKLDQAILDISPDDAADLNNKQRILRWDAKKNKFVKQTLKEMAEGNARGAKRMRTESGVVLSKNKQAKPGEMYEKWKKRSRKEVGAADNSDDRGAGPNMKVNQHVEEELRSADQIRKLHKQQANLKLKNTKKEKRTKIEASQRKKKQAAKNQKQLLQLNAGGRSRKAKVIVRT